MASQEKREFDKYLKFLTQKAVQVIVQSREGRKIETKGSSSNTEWFNLALPDKREIVSELKRKVELPFPQHKTPINVEITVETPEGDHFLVEVWSLSLDTTKRDITVSVSHTLYPRLTLILKSLLAMTRVVPAYQLSRKNEDIKFEYNISSGNIENEFLSTKDTQRAILGEVSSPYGTVSISVHYITVFTRPERSHVVTAATGTSSDTTDSITEGDQLHYFYSPLLADQKEQNLSSSFRQPFSTVLPREVPSVIRTPSGGETSLSLQYTGNSIGVDRQSSDEMNSITVHSNQDGFVVLDMNETRPAFGSAQHSTAGELTDLLQLSTDLPFLDMFTDGTDISTACNYLDQHSTFSSHISS